MKRNNFFFIFLLILLVLPISYPWGINYGENNLNLNPGQTYNFDIRLQNIENADKVIFYSIDDSYGLVINTSLQPPILLPANTTGYPNNELIGVSFTIYLPYNASEPSYRVVITFGEISSSSGGDIVMNIAQAIPITIRNTFVPEPVEPDPREEERRELMINILFILGLILMFLLITGFKKFRQKEEEGGENH